MLTAAHEDRKFMRRALREARRGWGLTHPNPMVGALIADQGRIVALGYHARDGGPHAEVEAIRALGCKPPPTATLYVTLEPCSTSGRTGACTDAIIEAGFRTVVIGAPDPNPRHNGRGVDLLRAAGITVRDGVRADECRDLNLIFNHQIVTGRPFVAAKVATTIDGRMATASGQSKWITGPRARADVMNWRRLFPAIAVGAGTVRADNPQLTSRRGRREFCPLRIIFDREMATVETPLPAVYDDRFAQRTMVICGAAADPQRRLRLEQQGVAIAECDATEPRDWWNQVLQRLTEAGINSVLIEGGPRLLGLLWQLRAVDYLLCYRAPKILADDRAPCAFSGRQPETLAEALQLENPVRTGLGADDLLRGSVIYPDEAHGTDT